MTDTTEILFLEVLKAVSQITGHHSADAVSAEGSSWPVSKLSSSSECSLDREPTLSAHVLFDSDSVSLSWRHMHVLARVQMPENSPGSWILPPIMLDARCRMCSFIDELVPKLPGSLPSPFPISLEEY